MGDTSSWMARSVGLMDCYCIFVEGIIIFFFCGRGGIDLYMCTASKGVTVRLVLSKIKGCSSPGDRTPVSRLPVERDNRYTSEALLS